MPDSMNDHDRRSYDIEIAQLKMNVESLTEEMKELSTDIKNLVEAWNTAKGMTSFVKWMSGMITAAGVIYAAIKGIK